MINASGASYDRYVPPDTGTDRTSGAGSLYMKMWNKLNREERGRAIAIDAFLIGCVRDPIVHLIKLIFQNPQATVSLSTALLTAYIAWQQYKNNVEQKNINKEKEKRELFEKRFEIFTTYNSALIDRINAKYGQYITNEQANALYAQGSKAMFLCSQGVYNALIQIRNHIYADNGNCLNPGGEHANDEYFNKRKMILHEDVVILQSIFSEYLDMRDK